ncbi:hypothetical protein IWW34DRAFT_148795 [Fusarium oxysporum f. sp. albedinis]|uniref:Uncharacterized protein n=1 Tax=Fusarium oxysporum f. sp. pisi HDV247 TaxID=1080344 RepID=W9NCJ4_FUSOX|nr:hypothetical protein FOVG_18146 [Fusarium oxysporum f. sp. pisi HDV247]KAI3573290.1 hypothetical protein IWW34DRAFT_148795 [Fusarium oxysporum f. sp. albedinis]KAJ9412412.1 hypothetical protein QL093DRAFT_2552918 [Fusarium oxysporum]
MRRITIAKPCSDDELVQKCKDETGKECSVIKWSWPRDLDESDPDDTLVAIIVDLDQSTQGSVRVYKGKEFIGLVGQTKDLVMIPWETGWTYMCFKQQHVGEVR